MSLLRRPSERIYPPLGKERAEGHRLIEASIRECKRQRDATWDRLIALMPPVGKKEPLPRGPDL